MAGFNTNILETGATNATSNINSQLDRITGGNANAAQDPGVLVGVVANVGQDVGVITAMQTMGSSLKDALQAAARS